MTFRALLLVCGLPLSPALFAQGPADHPLDAGLVAAFNGKFACKGQFANGRSIEANVAFEPQLDSHWLAYTHTDIPPNRYSARGYWGTDRETGKFVMMLVDIAGGARLFTGEGWMNGAVMFERVATPGQKERKERFRFEQESPTSFRMTYEVNTGDSWKLGDTILCAK